MLARLRSLPRRLRDRALAEAFGSLVAVRTTVRIAALTFDDGPDPDSTPRLLDLLARHGARATFFLIGARAARRPDLVARIAAEGHEIGNHSWDHPALPYLDDAAFDAQITRTRAVLAPHGARLMRPPYGGQSLRTFRRARRLGYEVVAWSIACEDWVAHDPATLAGRMLEPLAPGSVLLLHDSLFSFLAPADRDRAPVFAAVEAVLAARPDWRFVTVSEALRHGSPLRRFWTGCPEPDYLARLGFAESLADVPA